MPRKTTGSSNPTSRVKPNPKVKILKSRVTYRSPIFFVTSEQVREPSGVTTRRDIVRHSGSVVVMPVDDTGNEPRVMLIRQFRYAAGRDLWEFPAGRVDQGEQLLAGAKRELAEETGLTARNWKRAAFFWPSPGFLDETMTLFLARGLQQGQATPEEDEVIRPRFFPLAMAVKMVMSGKIQDGKTISGILWLDRFCSKNEG